MFKKLMDSGYKEFKRCEKIAHKVDSYADEVAKLSDDELRDKTEEFKEQYQNGKTLDLILPEAYAVVREASQRVTGMRPFFVQIIGAIAIHGGNIAEMKTGEGKTLTAVMPAYLNAISNKGVHIVTVNEYLAAREVEGEIGNIFRFLGLTVGLNVRALNQIQKQEAYDCDIMYTTNSELGFDYLRDHMVHHKNSLVNKRGLNYAIIDEVDSILIDEARTPLIISGGEKGNSNLYIQADQFVKRLQDEDYIEDIESQTVALSPQGITKAERSFNIDNLYDIKYVSLVHHIDNALKANIIFKKDKQYVVEEGAILIVDQFTGRILKGRQYSEGLHQAIEAKEGVEIKKETVTMATITYQNFFRMYKKLSGMTGTAKTEEEEFRNIYNMYVVEIPTNKAIIRKDLPDFLFMNLDNKYNALLTDITAIHNTGQPILLGTISVETSELLSKMLRRIGIKHEVLNAKNHEREAEIIEKAGQLGSVTIATNMAGRGTDIKLGEGVVELGGLAVIGTERHEARRIDNQLRGRSGRQGDPGVTRFYISADDELLKRFGGESFKNRIGMLIRLNSDKDMSKPLESKMFSRFVTSAQKRIEGYNFDTRKNVLKYDDVLRKQREIFYAQRTEIIMKDDISDICSNWINTCCETLAFKHMTEVGRNKYEIDDEGLINSFNGNIFPPKTLKLEDIAKMDEEEIIAYIKEKAFKNLEEKKAICPPEVYLEFLKLVAIRVIDTFWTQHIDTMSELRQGVTLQAYAQTNPLTVYQAEGFKMFNKMLENIAIDITKYLMRAQIRIQQEREEEKQNLTTNQADDTSRKSKPVTKNTKVGRNDLCPCGSGKKYKYCCER